MSLHFQPEPPLVQLETITSRPIANYLKEEADPHLPPTFFQVVAALCHDRCNYLPILDPCTAFMVWKFLRKCDWL